MVTELIINRKIANKSDAYYKLFITESGTDLRISFNNTFNLFKDTGKAFYNQQMWIYYCQKIAIYIPFDFFKTKYLHLVDEYPISRIFPDIMQFP